MKELRQLHVHLQDLEGFHRVLEAVVSLAQDVCIVAPLHHVPVRLHTAAYACQCLRLLWLRKRNQKEHDQSIANHLPQGPIITLSCLYRHEDLLHSLSGKPWSQDICLEAWTGRMTAWQHEADIDMP